MSTPPETFRYLPRADVEPGPNQPRKHFDEAKLQELADNIKAVGIIQPLIVRSLSKWKLEKSGADWILSFEGKDRTSFRDEAKAREEYWKVTGKFEIVAGERRWRAAGLAKLEQLPCIVRDLTDQQVLEMQGIENLQREDLTPIEEAEWLRRLLDSKAYTVETLAAKIGKQRSTIFARLRLLRLSPPVRAALLEGKIDATKAGLIAQIPDPKRQEARLKEALEPDTWNDEPMSSRDLKNEIARKDTRSLKNANFSTKVEFADLPGVKGVVCSCDDCPKRSGNMKKEFPEIGATNICTDPACFDRKAAATRSDLLAPFKAKGYEILPEKKAEQIFCNDDDAKKPELTWQGERAFVEVDARVPDDKKKRTWQELLTPEMKPVIALDPNGRPRELLPMKAALEAARAAGVKLKDPNAPQDDSYAKERARKEAKAKLLDSVAPAALARLIVAAEQAATVDVLHLLAEYAGGWEAMKRRNWKRENQTRELAKLTTAQTLGFLVEAQFGHAVDGWKGDWDAAFSAACKHLGVDLAAFEKQAKSPEPDKKTKKKK